MCVAECRASLVACSKTCATLWLQALALVPRQTFSLEWDKVRKEIADEKAGILPPPLVPKMPLVVTLGKKRKPAAKGKGVLPPHFLGMKDPMSDLDVCSSCNLFTD